MKNTSVHPKRKFKPQEATKGVSLPSMEAHQRTESQKLEQARTEEEMPPIIPS